MHTPIRRCRVCRKNAPKAELTRWVFQNDTLQHDVDQKRQSRGVYSCTGSCSEKILTKSLRALR
jgi:predicted RNA-binding protein YlxR (DUF448 family)